MKCLNLILTFSLIFPIQAQSSSARDRLATATRSAESIDQSRRVHQLWTQYRAEAGMIQDSIHRTLRLPFPRNPQIHTVDDSIRLMIDWIHWAERAPEVQKRDKFPKFVLTDDKGNVIAEYDRHEFQKIRSDIMAYEREIVRSFQENFKSQIVRFEPGKLSSQTPNTPKLMAADPNLSSADRAALADDFSKLESYVIHSSRPAFSTSDLPPIRTPTFAELARTEQRALFDQTLRTARNLSGNHRLSRNPGPRRLRQLLGEIAVVSAGVLGASAAMASTSSAPQPSVPDVRDPESVQETGY